MPSTKTRPSAPTKPKHLSSFSSLNPAARLPSRNAAFPQARAQKYARGDGEGDEQETEAEETADESNSEEQSGDVPADDKSVAPTAQGHPSKAPEKKRKPKLHPQERIWQIWKNFEPEYHGKVTKILPDPVPTSATLRTKPRFSQNATESYKDAKTHCEHAVKMIVAECVSLNQKYTDVHFDLERDLKVTQRRDCIDGLAQDEADRDNPSDVKRVTDLFEAPMFFSDGAGFDDIMQGGLGDCWMMSAFSVLSSNEELLRKVCVVQDQEVGVYGFVFFRDGEWHPTIIDDKLYLSSSAFDEGVDTMLSAWGKDQERKYNELFQRGSKALYFAKCRDDNETWVPLLEKALAKAHGGYDALRGGQTGEAIEDLTGGVATEVYSNNILSKEKFWTNELSNIGKEFLFDAGAARYQDWIGWNEDVQFISHVRAERKKGIIGRHAYAVLDTYEGYGQRLVKVRNPWGKSEWTGDWSDGSSKWTSEWLDRVGHQFGDDGVFWMSYKDFLNHFKNINRTRIFDDSWFTAQRWASMQVPFNHNLEYQQTKFTIDVPDDTQVVIVLSQLDDRYFSGLEGQYGYRLSFRVSMADNEDEYIARSRPGYELERSTNIELFLTQGKYTVLVKIEAVDYGRPSPQDVIKDNLPHRKEKVTTIGRLYDLAHQKGLPEPEEEIATPTTDDAMTDERSRSSKEIDPGARAATKSDQPEPKPVSITNPLPVMIVQAPPADSDEEDEEQDEKQPWNASCVVGLRVYSKLADLSVGIIWPPKPKVDEEVKTPALDRDDITKAPMEEAEKAAEEEGEEEEEEAAEAAEEELELMKIGVDGDGEQDEEEEQKAKKHKKRHRHGKKHDAPAEKSNIPFTGGKGKNKHQQEAEVEEEEE